MQSLNQSMALIQPSGSLNASNAVELQRQLLSQLQADHVPGLVVDMSKVESLDSAALISLVSALKAARQSSKRFCLMAVPPTISMVFELTQLDRAFEFVDDLAPMPLAA